MKVEVLYFGGCPSHERLMPTLLALAGAYNAEIVQRRVETPEDAEVVRFLGSPSVRVDGRDIEPGAERRTDYGVKCRLYRSPAGRSGVPPHEWLERALATTRDCAG
jgi:hypothetical protein